MIKIKFVGRDLRFNPDVPPTASVSPSRWTIPREIHRQQEMHRSPRTSGEVHPIRPASSPSPRPDPVSSLLHHNDCHPRRRRGEEGAGALRAQPHGPDASGRPSHGPLQLSLCAEAQRRLRSPPRGHRPGTWCLFYLFIY